MNFSTTREQSSLEPTEPTEENSLTGKIIGAAIDVHRTLGPGLLESAYETCLAYELRLRKLKVESQKAIAAIHEAQLMSYLKLSGCRYGLLINFNVKLLREGLRRFKI